jgi:hypothetical protein
MSEATSPRTGREAYYQLDADDMPWTCHATPGVSYKPLRYDHDKRAGAVMIHLCPGATYPTYQAHAGQDVLVLDGELKLGDATIRRGGYLHVEPGSVQAPSTHQGCVLFVSFPGSVKHLHDGD